MPVVERTMVDNPDSHLPLPAEERALGRSAWNLAPAEPYQRPLTLRTVLDLFARQHLSMIIIISLALTIGIIAVFTTTPIYASVTDILVEGRTQSNPGTNPNDPIEQVSLPNPETDIITQIQVLQSSKLREDSFALAGVNFSVDDIETGKAPNVDVEQVGATSVLRVRVESANAQAAQSLAQVIPQVYLGYVRTTRQGEATSALQSLENRLEAEQAEFDKALKELQTFRQSRSLLPLSQEAGLRSSKMSELETEAARAQAVVAGAKERLASLLAQRAKLPDTLRDTASQANSREIEAQKGIISDLKARREALLVQFLPTHEQVKALDAQIAGAERRLAEIPREIDLSTSSLHPEILKMEERITNARAELKSAEAAAVGIGRTSARAKAALEEYYQIEPKEQELARAVEDRRVAIVNMSRSLDELRVRSSAVKDPVTVLTAATSPFKIRPNELQYLGVSFLVGLFFAVVFAAAKDGFEERVINADELAAESRLEVLGEVPVNRTKKRQVDPAHLGESTRELYRQLRHRMLLASNGVMRGSLLVAGSGGTNEGTSELVANLAIGFAAQQKSVIVVDADLRARDSAKWLGTEPEPGLSDVIAGRVELSNAIQKTQYDGVRHLAAGTKTMNPTDLLSSEASAKLFAEMKTLAEFVLVIGPGFTEAADSEILASYVDGTVLVARLLGTSRRSFTASMLPTRRSVNPPFGLILTREASRRSLQSS